MRYIHPQEFKVVSLRECPSTRAMACVETPEQAVRYWRQHIATAPTYNRDIEQLAVLMLNTRRRCLGHQIISIGTINECLIDPRQVFRAAIIACAHAIVLMHNHPSGDPTPSRDDMKVTPALVQGGNLLNIDVVDHVIIGHPRRFKSMRELGFIYSELTQ